MAPSASEPAGTVAARVVPAPSAGERAVVVVHDDPHIVTLLRRYLHGFWVVGAETWEEGLALAEEAHAVAMITGGFEAAVTPIGIAAFDRMRALSHRNDDPAGASRPFDRDRDGFVMAEGGAILVLEELGFALRRGVLPLSELVACAATSDAAHLTAPDPEGSGSALCMALALQRAGIEPGQVSYINAHGTGTPSGDLAETHAIKTAFGEYAYRVPVSSTKSMTGHMLGGSGALEAVITIMALSTGILPPTINLHTPDPECDLDYIPWQSRRADPEIALSNSFGFGGHNGTLVFRRYIG